jgi:hypothetical protein
LPNKTWTAEEILCEEHFKKHTAQDDTGCYIVRLPWRKGQGSLGELYEKPRRRFHHLEQWFQEHPVLHQAYSEFVQEYEDLGHMNQINKDASSTEEWYSLPHHTVFKSSPAEFITKFSALSRLHRISAYCMRFSHNARNPSLRRTGYLTSTELRDALLVCIKTAQQEFSAQEINDLCKKGQVLSKSQLQPLHPFLDIESYL